MYPFRNGWSRLLGVIAVAGIIGACSEGGGGVVDDDDDDDDDQYPPPAAIADLHVIDSSLTAVTLGWTVPDSNATHDRARMYDLRFHYAPITALNWSQAAPWFSVPVPGSCGSAQSVKVAGLAANARYYFAIDCNNLHGQWSGISNVVTAQTLSDFQVTCPDTALNSLIREELGKPIAPIYASELTVIVELVGEGRGISDLTGLEYFTNLGILHLSENPIADLSPLSGLKSLKILGMRAAQVSDLTPLSGLTGLEQLSMPNNQISDLTPLANLASIILLALHYNQIVDIGPLVTNPGLGAGDMVTLNGNPLSEQSLTVHIPALEARGVLVQR